MQSLDGVPKTFSPRPPSNRWTSILSRELAQYSRELFTCWYGIAFQSYEQNKFPPIGDAAQHNGHSIFLVTRHPELHFLRTLLVPGVRHRHIKEHRGLVGIRNLSQLVAVFSAFVHYVPLKLRELLLEVIWKLLTLAGLSSQAESKPRNMFSSPCWL